MLLSCAAAGCGEDRARIPSQEPYASAALVQRDFVVVPGLTNAVQFRLYTSGAPRAPGLFNTFDIEAYGETLLRSPGGDPLQRWLATSPSNPVLHNVLINGRGPELASTNGMTVIEQATGPEWRYLALDVSAAYRDRLERYRRGILFVEPDLFVLYDQIVAREPVSFQMLLHAPAATRVDDDWRDLRLELPGAGFRIQSPGEKRKPRSWERIESPADALLPGTVTMRLGPTNQLARIDLLTVFAVYRGGVKKDYAFKLLESNTAVGARIYREGLPTLVAFRMDPAAGSSCLTGFGFNGPVGVDVFKPKQRAR
jgi:hypothetical protein